MKKLIVFVFMLVALFVVLDVKQKKNPLLSCEAVEKVCIISNVNMDHYDGVETIICGNDFFNFCSLKDAMLYIDNIEKHAMQFYLSDYSAEEFCKLMKIDIASQQEIEGMTVFCGYTPFVSGGVILDEKRINVQFVSKGENLIAGFPLIVTGY